MHSLNVRKQNELAGLDGPLTMDLKPDVALLENPVRLALDDATRAPVCLVAVHAHTRP